jgi:hypothetical protein
MPKKRFSAEQIVSLLRQLRQIEMRPAQPSRRSDYPVLRNEGELHVESFAK